MIKARPSAPHPRVDILLFLPDSRGIDRRGFHAGVPHPFLQHMELDAVGSGIDPVAMPQALRGSMRRIGDSSLDHHTFDNLPDADTGKVPDRHILALCRSLRLTEAMGGIEGVQIVRRDWNSPVDGFLAAGGVLALLEGAKRNRPA